MPTLEQAYTPFFHQLCDAAGQIVVKYFRQDIPVDDKQDKSPVTQADREIEQVLRGMINKAFPDHGIIGEEFGRENEHAEFVWCLDPIDGTKSFITGRPMFGTIIGLLREGKPVMGAVDQAVTKERWLGVTNQSATCNGKPARVAPPRKLESSKLYVGSLDMFRGEDIWNYLRLCHAAKLTQYACDVYAYGLLAIGWCDVVVEKRLKIHDVAGVIPIVTGAGGVAWDWQSQALAEKNLIADYDGKFIAASSQPLAEECAVLLTTQNPSRDNPFEREQT
ncbi:MAG: inositol monophosphatase family protein [Bdellovibrionales bacterium]